MSAADVGKMSVQEIKEAYAARFEGWAAEEDRLFDLMRSKRTSSAGACKIRARAYRDVAADLRKIGGPV